MRSCYKFKFFVAYSVAIAMGTFATAGNAIAHNKKCYKKSCYSTPSKKIKMARFLPLHRGDDAKKSYVGIDVSVISEMIKMNNIQEGFGKNIYNKNPLMLGVFFGYNFEDFGIEFSYEGQLRRKRETTLSAGDPLPGGTILVGAEKVTFNTELNTHHLQLLGNKVLYRFGGKNKFDLFLQAGFSYSRLYAKQVPTNAENIVYAPEDKTRTFRQWKLIPAAKVGINYHLSDTFGVRLIAGWKHLNMLKVKSEEAPNTTSEIRLKDGFSCALGAFYYFK